MQSRNIVKQEQNENVGISVCIVTLLRCEMECKLPGTRISEKSVSPKSKPPTRISPNVSEFQ